MEPRSHNHVRASLGFFVFLFYLIRIVRVCCYFSKASPGSPTDQRTTGTAIWILLTLGWRKESNKTQMLQYSLESRVLYIPIKHSYPPKPIFWDTRTIAFEAIFTFYDYLGCHSLYRHVMNLGCAWFFNFCNVQSCLLKLCQVLPWSPFHGELSKGSKYFPESLSLLSPVVTAVVSPGCCYLDAIFSLLFLLLEAVLANQSLYCWQGHWE